MPSVQEILNKSRESFKDKPQLFQTYGGIKEGLPGGPESQESARLGQDIVTVIDVSALLVAGVAAALSTFGGAGVIAAEAGGTGGVATGAGAAGGAAAGGSLLNKVGSVPVGVAAGVAGNQLGQQLTGALDLRQSRASSYVSLYRDGIITRDELVGKLDALGLGKSGDPKSDTNLLTLQADKQLADELAKTQAKEAAANAPVNAQGLTQGEVDAANTEFNKAYRDSEVERQKQESGQKKAPTTQELGGKPSSETPTDPDILKQRRIRKGSVK